MIPLTQLVSTVSFFNIKCPVLSLKISFGWMTLFMNNMCAALHFFSMISLTDRSCGYLPYLPFPNISSDGHIKHRCKSKGQSRGNPHSVTDLSYTNMPMLQLKILQKCTSQYKSSAQVDFVCLRQYSLMIMCCQTPFCLFLTTSF